MTRDHWIDLMEAVSLQNSASTPCISSPTYDDFIANGNQTVGCGKPGWAELYFFTYSFTISVVFLSLFTAIICAAYFAVSDNNKDEKFAEMIQHFRIIWSNFDPSATGKIEDKEFDLLIFALDDPLGLNERHRFDKKLLKYYKQRIGARMEKHKKSQRTQWYFDEVLDNLLFFVLIYERVKQEMETTKIKKFETFKLKRTSILNENVNISRLKKISTAHIMVDGETISPIRRCFNADDDSSPIKLIRLNILQNSNRKKEASASHRSIKYSRSGKKMSREESRYSQASEEEKSQLNWYMSSCDRLPPINNKKQLALNLFEMGLNQMELGSNAESARSDENNLEEEKAFDEHCLDSEEQR